LNALKKEEESLKEEIAAINILNTYENVKIF